MTRDSFIESRRHDAALERAEVSVSRTSQKMTDSFQETPSPFQAFSPTGKVRGAAA
jgi:hypothetical protein